jgi:hypothetical protein
MPHSLKKKRNTITTSLPREFLSSMLLADRKDSRSFQKDIATEGEDLDSDST